MMERIMTTQTTPPKPEKSFRIGFVAANVFVNELEEDGRTSEVRSVELQKMYRDGDDWKATNALTLADLPAAVRLLQLAQQHVEAVEAEVFIGPE
jgi:hypothetical protein